jgi:tetratricopeptide (TPR) repeat protein
MRAGVVIACASFSCVTFLSGCLSSTEIDMKRARAMLAEKKPAEAAALFERVVEKQGNTPDSAAAALEAGKIYQYDLKKFDFAIKSYRTVIARSQDAAIRRDAQAKVAGLLFYDVQDFSAAITEYSKLLNLQHTLPEEIEWRSRIAKAYYYLGNYFQAGIETDRLLKIATGIDEEAVYQAYLLKANILVGARDHDQAAKVLDSMMSQFPDRARRDSIPLMLAVAFEEQRNYAKAIEVLSKVREYDPRKSFFDEKIKSLKERQAQQPGARGFHK